MKQFLCKGFFGARVKAVKLMKNFNQQYYFDNFDKSLTQQGFPQATIKINNVDVKLIGVPIIREESLTSYETNLEELNNLLLEEENTPGSQFLIQLDPTPYLYIRRLISSQYIRETEPLTKAMLDDHLLKNAPMMPLDQNELMIDIKIFDMLHVLDQQDHSGGLNEDQNKLLQQIIAGEDVGYFSKTLVDQAKNQGNQDELEFQQEYEKIQTKALFYEYQNNVRASTPYLSMALFYSMMQGPTYLGDLSKVYLRIYAGNILGLEELRAVFKEILAVQLEDPDSPIELPLEAAQVSWRQFMKDFYLIFTINKIVSEAKDLTKLTVFVESLHFDPLRTILTSQEGEIIQEVDKGYVENFTFPQSKKQDTDEQMIEKHVLLDLIEDLPIWKERFIKNPFPYISQDYSQLNPQDQKEVQKTFFKYHSQYQRIQNNSKGGNPPK